MKKLLIIATLLALPFTGGATEVINTALSKPVAVKATESNKKAKAVIIVDQSKSQSPGITLLKFQF